MYDLIRTDRKLNKKKIIALIVLLVLLIVIISILGIRKTEKENNRRYALELQRQQEEINNQIEEEKRIKEEAAQREADEKMKKICSPLSEEAKNNIRHIYNSTGEKRVFLTFDDGPSTAVTPFILDTLKQANIKATFFILGCNAINNTELIQREFMEGHYIANHGYTHRYQDVYASPEATLNEYNLTQQIVREALRNPSYMGNVFRFPGGSNGGLYDEQKQNSKQLLYDNGIVHLDWNSLSEDAAGRYTKEELLQNTINTIGEHDSVVILLHDSSDKILTYEMLPDLINYLKERGYSFKNLYDII